MILTIVSLFQDYSIREVLIKDGSKATTPSAIQPQSALQALKIKARISRPMDSKVASWLTVVEC